MLLAHFVATIVACGSPMESPGNYSCISTQMQIEGSSVRECLLQVDMALEDGMVSRDFYTRTVICHMDRNKPQRWISHKPK